MTSPEVTEIHSSQLTMSMMERQNILQSEEYWTTLHTFVETRRQVEFLYSQFSPEREMLTVEYENALPNSHDSMHYTREMSVPTYIESATTRPIKKPVSRIQKTLQYQTSFGIPKKPRGSARTNHNSTSQPSTKTKRSLENKDYDRVVRPQKRRRVKGASKPNIRPQSTQIWESEPHAFDINGSNGDSTIPTTVYAYTTGEPLPAESQGIENPYTSTTSLYQQRHKGVSHNSENKQGSGGPCNPPYPSYDHVLRVFAMGPYRGRAAPVVDVSTLAKFHSISDSNVINQVKKALQSWCEQTGFDYYPHHLASMGDLQTRKLQPPKSAAWKKTRPITKEEDFYECVKTIASSAGLEQFWENTPHYINQALQIWNEKNPQNPFQTQIEEVSYSGSTVAGILPCRANWDPLVGSYVPVSDGEEASASEAPAPAAEEPDTDIWVPATQGGSLSFIDPQLLDL